MCDLCDESPKVREAAAQHARGIGDKLIRLGNLYHQLAAGHAVKPHAEPWTAERTRWLAVDLVRILVEDWVR